MGSPAASPSPFLRPGKSGYLRSGLLEIIAFGAAALLLVGGPRVLSAGATVVSRLQLRAPAVHAPPDYPEDFIATPAPTIPPPRTPAPPAGAPAAVTEVPPEKPPRPSSPEEVAAGMRQAALTRRTAPPSPAITPTPPARSPLTPPPLAQAVPIPTSTPTPIPTVAAATPRAADSTTSVPAETSRRKHFTALLDQGVALYRLGWYGPALARFRRAAVVMPDSPSAYLWVGRAAMRAERPQEAREALERVIVLAPSSQAAREAAILLRQLSGNSD